MVAAICMKGGRSSKQKLCEHCINFIYIQLASVRLTWHLHEGLVEADQLGRLHGRGEDGQREQEVVVLGQVHGLVQPDVRVAPRLAGRRFNRIFSAQHRPKNWPEMTFAGVVTDPKKRN